MRKVSPLLALVVAGLSIAGLQSHADAAVGIYYVGASVDSMWAYQRGADSVQSPGVSPSTTFGSTSGGAYLSGTWGFDNTSSIDAPAGIPGFRLGAAGMANGLGTLTASVSSDGFSVSGRGYGEVAYDATPTTGTDADTLYAGGTAMLSFNFAIPSGGSDYTLRMATGTASADDDTIIMVRLAGTDGLGQVTTLIDFQTDGTQIADSDSWTGQDYVLSAGSFYVFDLYANPNAPYADATFPDQFFATSQFNLIGTFVPEPTALFLMLGGAVLTLRRRRERSNLI